MENCVKNINYSNNISKIEKKGMFLKIASRKIKDYWHIRFTNKNGQLHIVVNLCKCLIFNDIYKNPGFRKFYNFSYIQ